MHKTPKHIFEEIERERPYCERNYLLRDHLCQGRSTMEHVWIYAGKQMNEKFSIIRLCEWAHLGPGLNKRINEWISLHHATEEDLKKYPKKEWNAIKKHLDKLFNQT
jgi:hypothetical protein